MACKRVFRTRSIRAEVQRSQALGVQAVIRCRLENVFTFREQREGGFAALRSKAMYKPLSVCLGFSWNQGHAVHDPFWCVHCAVKSELVQACCTTSRTPISTPISDAHRARSRSSALLPASRFDRRLQLVKAGDLQGLHLQALEQ